MPAFNYMVLPNDHTRRHGARRRTPAALVADNDYGLGPDRRPDLALVDLKASAIFVVEDDSQDGADHVDAHRIPAAVISPYTRRGAVVHTRYDFLSVIRSIELILGMHPLGLFDGLATPMYDAFSPRDEPERLQRHPAQGRHQSAQRGQRREPARDEGPDVSQRPDPAQVRPAPVALGEGLGLQAASAGPNANDRDRLRHGRRLSATAPGAAPICALPKLNKESDQWVYSTEGSNRHGIGAGSAATPRRFVAGQGARPINDLDTDGAEETAGPDPGRDRRLGGDLIEGRRAHKLVQTAIDVRPGRHRGD